jgi:nicotinate-nucleotide pyrophosphorylase (carboxylating)
MSCSSSPTPALRWSPAIGLLIDLALEEDIGRGDVTTELLGEHRQGCGRVVCRVPVVACGLPLLGWLVARGAPELTARSCVSEGELAPAGSTLATLVGPAGAILRLERTALNFLMRLCGVATLTRRYVQEVAATGARVVDTRKTLPGWRVLDKYAVRVGGGGNHRADLGSGILIKDNHIAACGSTTEAVRRARAGAPHPLRIEVEVENLAQAEEALAAGAEVLLLDNMTAAQVREVSSALGGRTQLEISGGVTLQTIRAYAEAGARLISVGALTHSAPAVDLSLELEATRDEGSER